jgi:hypothetical protein
MAEPPELDPKVKILHMVFEQFIEEQKTEKAALEAKLKSEKHKNTEIKPLAMLLARAVLDNKPIAKKHADAVIMLLMEEELSK